MKDETIQAMPASGLTRRGLMGPAAATAASAFAGIQRLRAQSPNNKVVLGLIGAGGRGTTLGVNFATVENTEFKYVCEVNAERGEPLMRKLEEIRGKRPQRVIDMRQVLDDKDVDGVVIATPEHWHALATVWACQAGKDVYVEKNPSFTIWEGRKMIEAARKYNRIVDVGFENRSGPYSVTAREYIATGKLGKVQLIKVYNMLPGPTELKAEPESQPPDGLDWDRFLGPAPERPYTPARLHRWGDFWDYAGGTLSGDASHQFDLIRMVLGEPAAPRAVNTSGGRYAFHDTAEVPDTQIVTFEYPEMVMTCENTTFTPFMVKSNREERMGTKWPFWPQNGERIEIYGTRQMMYLGRHGIGWQVLEGDGKIVAQDKGYFPDKWHQPNFVDCIRSRRKPNADIELAHQSAILVHLGNVSYRVGCKKLYFDAVLERFIDHEEANRFLKPAYRKNYRIPDSV
jgi:predicted dehydrogenase